jgi:chromosome segregation ATPase
MAIHQWLPNILRFISPAQAQAAHIRLIEAELHKQKDESDAAYRKQNDEFEALIKKLQMELADKNESIHIANTENKALAEELERCKQHCNRLISHNANSPKRGNKSWVSD